MTERAPRRAASPPETFPMQYDGERGMFIPGTNSGNVINFNPDINNSAVQTVGGGVGEGLPTSRTIEITEPPVETTTPPPEVARAETIEPSVPERRTGRDKRSGSDRRRGERRRRQDRAEVPSPEEEAPAAPQPAEERGETATREETETRQGPEQEGGDHERYRREYIDPENILELKNAFKELSERGATGVRGVNSLQQLRELDPHYAQSIEEMARSQLLFEYFRTVDRGRVPEELRNDVINLMNVSEGTLRMLMLRPEGEGPPPPGGEEPPEPPGPPGETPPPGEEPPRPPVVGAGAFPRRPEGPEEPEEPGHRVVGAGAMTSRPRAPEGEEPSPGTDAEEVRDGWFRRLRRRFRRDRDRLNGLYAERTTNVLVGGDDEDPDTRRRRRNIIFGALAATAVGSFLLGYLTGWGVHEGHGGSSASSGRHFEEWGGPNSGVELPGSLELVENDGYGKDIVNEDTGEPVVEGAGQNRQGDLDETTKEQLKDEGYDLDQKRLPDNGRHYTQVEEPS